MSGELEATNWKACDVAIPGFTDSFPKGVTEYPINNRPTGEIK